MAAPAAGQAMDVHSKGWPSAARQMPRGRWGTSEKYERDLEKKFELRQKTDAPVVVPVSQKPLFMAHTSPEHPGKLLARLSSRVPQDGEAVFRAPCCVKGALHMGHDMVVCVRKKLELVDIICLAVGDDKLAQSLAGQFVPNAPDLKVSSLIHALNWGGSHDSPWRRWRRASRVSVS